MGAAGMSNSDVGVCIARQCCNKALPLLQTCIYQGTDTRAQTCLQKLHKAVQQLTLFECHTGSCLCTFELWNRLAYM